MKIYLLIFGFFAFQIWQIKHRALYHAFPSWYLFVASTFFAMLTGYFNLLLQIAFFVFLYMFLLTNKPLYWYIGNYNCLTFFWDNESYSPIQLSMIHYRNHLLSNLFIVHFWWGLHASCGRSTWVAKAEAVAISIGGTPPCSRRWRDPAMPPDAGFLTVLLHQDFPICIAFCLPLDSRYQAKKEGDKDGILAGMSFHGGKSGRRR